MKIRMTSLFQVVSFIVLGLGLSSGAGATPRVIYGDDNRLDVFEVQNPMLKALSGSTVALFEAEDVTMDLQRGSAKLNVKQYGATANLCTNERFFEQPMGAFCSGFLVGPDLLVTAGHCSQNEAQCKKTKFVFGFALNGKDADPSKVPSSEVYGCSQLIARQQVGTGADWALIKLDRAVKNHKPLKLNRNNDIAPGVSLVVMGHPVGIPLKVSGGAKVRDASKPGFFVANLDTYGGNSGSAVVNEFTGEVEGILVRGETDFVMATSTPGSMCRSSKKCTNEGCRGEDVTRINAVLSSIH